MPGLATSFLEHEREQYEQPMVRIASAKRRDHMLQEDGEPAADGKERGHYSYRAPELLCVELVPAGLWRQAQALPWVLGTPGGRPGPGHLVYAITLAPAADCWEMEILGDAFLKYSVGLFFHYKMTNDVTSPWWPRCWACPRAQCAAPGWTQSPTGGRPASQHGSCV